MTRSPPASVEKDPTRMRLDGGEFEYKLAGLAGARLRAERVRRPELNLEFSIYSNVQGANPFDDLVLHLKWFEGKKECRLNYFVQLKHSERDDKVVTRNDLTSKRRSKRSKNFNLRKYFEGYLSIKEIANSSSESDHNRQVLSEWIREECRFVLFTTRNVIQNECHDTQTSFPHFPFHYVFSTGQGEVFSFGENNPLVWNMYEGEPECRVFRTEFLPRLLIFGGQVHASQLDPLIQIALLDAVGGEMPREELFLSKYLCFLRKWWDGDHCISESSTELEKIIQYFVNDNAEFVSLQFQPRLYKELKCRLEKHSVTLNIVPEISIRVRSSKIKRVMEENYPDRYLILTESSFRDYPESALEVVVRNNCEELVLNVDDMDIRLQNFTGRILNERKCKVRILQSQLNPKIESFIKSHTGQCIQVLDNYWTLEHLSLYEQKRLLDRRVWVQGEETTLARLEGVWPSLRRGVSGATLDALACGDEVSLGAPLPLPDPFYIPRTVQHKAVLHKGLWKTQSADDVFLLNGFPEDVLRDLRSPSSCWEEWDLLAESPSRVLQLSKEVSSDSKDSMNRKRNKTKWSLWTDPANTESLRFFESKNVHWLTYEGEEIVWLETRGNHEVLRNYLKNIDSHCNISPVCTHYDIDDFIDWQGVFLLTGDPGMGKSTFLCRLAYIVKKENPVHWVAVLRLNEGRLLENMGIIDQESVVDLLLRASHVQVSLENTSTKNFLRDNLLQSGNISIFVDGVDDVCPIHKTKLLSVLKFLLQKTNFQRVWIAGRTMLEDDLGRATRSLPFTLLPFSAEDQKRYLLAYWGGYSDEMDGEEFQSSVDQLVDDVRSATQHNGRSLCDVPLYSHVLAVAYRNDHSILQNLASPHSSNPRRKRINLLALIKKFVEETRKGYWQKVDISVGLHRWATKLEEEFHREHQTCAAFVSFCGCDLLGNFMTDIAKEVEELAQDRERERTGIITKFVDGKPQFIHKVFAEFFCAQWLVGHFERLEVHALHALVGGRFEDVRGFFDALLCDGLPLHEAALAGSVDGVRAALRRGAQVEEEDRGGRRALHLAAICGREDAAARLLRAGADARPRDALRRWTPLRYADHMLRFTHAGAGEEARVAEDSLQHLRVVDVLLGGGARLHECKRCLQHKEAALRAALQHDLPHVAEELVRRKGPVFAHRARRGGGTGPAARLVRLAVAHDSSRCIAMFLRRGFDVSRHLEGGTSPLHVFAGDGDVALVTRLLKHGAPPQGRTAVWALTPLHKAAEGGHASVCRLLLDFGADADGATPLGVTPLHLAARAGHRDVCQLLLQRGARVDARDWNGVTALRWAARADHYDVCALLRDHGADTRWASFRALAGEGTRALCRLLVEGGASASAADEAGVPPLHWAVRARNAALCHALLDHGADVNARSGKGEPALLWAARAHSEDMAALLLARGAAASAGDAQGQTALHACARLGREALCQLLLRAGAAADARDALGATPLHHAAAHGHFLVCALLAEHGADAHAADARGHTPLHAAAAEGREWVVKLLVERCGARAGARGAAGETPLHLAAGRGRARLCRLLREYGADALARDARGATPYDAALAAGHAAACDALPAPPHTPVTDL